MKALLLENRGILALRNVKLPSPKAGETVIDVVITGIGGSEYLGYDRPGIRKLPNIMGHGIAGTTPDGRRAVINPLRSCRRCIYCEQEQYQLCDQWALIGVQIEGGFAQKVVVPDDSIIYLPDCLTWEQATFIEPFANSVNAWEISGATAESSIAILGTGSLGLGLVASASSASCTTVAICEPSQERAAAACKLGAHVPEQYSSGSFDVVFDTVGTVESRHKALDLTRKGGRCVFMGFATQTMEVDISSVIRHQTQLLGAFAYSRRQFVRAIELAHMTDSAWVVGVSFEGVEPMLVEFLKGDFSIIKAALRPFSDKGGS